MIVRGRTLGRGAPLSRVFIRIFRSLVDQHTLQTSYYFFFFRPHYIIVPTRTVAHEPQQCYFWFALHTYSSYDVFIGSIAVRVKCYGVFFFFKSETSLHKHLAAVPQHQYLCVLAGRVFNYCIFVIFIGFAYTFSDRGL